MQWAIFLRHGADWFLFKVFNDFDKAKASREGFKKSGFDCLLIYAGSHNSLLDIQRMLRGQE